MSEVEAPEPERPRQEAGFQKRRSGATVHVHAGACDRMARVVLLEGDSLAPGHCLAAQLIMQDPISIWRGDRVVLRDASASRTIGRP